MDKLMTSMTTDKQLYDLANMVGLRLEPIVFKDELSLLPKPTEKRNYNYIINMSNSNELGSHWVALFVDAKRGISYFFNSFADEFDSIPDEITQFTKRIGSILCKNTKPIQNPSRGYCGQYCILFLIKLNRPTDDIYDYNDFLKIFKNTMNSIDKYKEKHKL